MGWDPVDPSCKGGRVLRNPVIRTVPSDWEGIPKDSANEPIFGAGESFRLMFVTAGKRNATAANIAIYNAFVQSQAESGWQPIRGYADDFRVLASTFDVDARENTYTLGTGVPIYWMNGNKVADDYGGLYPEFGTWENRNDQRQSNGNSWSATASSDDYVFTGSWKDGTTSIEPGVGASLNGPLGHTEVAVGVPFWD